MNSRRSRMHRTRTGKSLALTDRDLTIFQTLSQYRYLRSTYLHAFAGGASEKRFIERLGDLFHEGFLNRPEMQWTFASARTAPAVYEIEAGGRHALSASGESVGEARTFPSPNVHRQFLHTLMICECLASIELAAIGREDVRFIPWGEILAKAPEATRRAPAPFRIPVGNTAVIPDGLFGLEYRGSERKTYRFFALEADRATMPVARTDSRQTSYLAKLAAYREIIAHRLHKTQWGIPNLLVLTVTTSDQRVNDIMRRTTDGASFLFKVVQPEALRFPLPTLLTEPWQRPDATPFNMNKSGQPES